MRIQVTSSTSKSLEMVIEDEDISPADIIHHELLKDDRVVFAGATQPHPLLKRVNLTLEVKRGNPATTLVSSGTKAATRVAELLAKAREAFGKTRSSE